MKANQQSCLVEIEHASRQASGDSVLGHIASTEARNAEWQPKALPSIDAYVYGRAIPEISLLKPRIGGKIIATKGAFEPPLADVGVAVMRKGGSGSEHIDTTLLEAIANKRPDRTYTVGDAALKTLSTKKMRPEQRAAVVRMQDELEVRKEASKHLPSEFLDIVKDGDQTSLVLDETGNLGKFRISLEEVKRMVEDIKEYSKAGTDVFEDDTWKNATETMGREDVRMEGAEIDPINVVARESIGRSWTEEVRPALEKFVSQETLAKVDEMMKSPENMVEGKFSEEAEGGLRNILKKDSTSIMAELSKLFAAASEEKAPEHILDKVVDFFSKVRETFSTVLPGHDYLRYVTEKAAKMWESKGVGGSPSLGMTVAEFEKMYNTKFFTEMNGFDPNDKVTVNMLMDVVSDEKQSGKVRLAAMTKAIEDSGLVDKFLALTDEDTLTKRWHEYVDEKRRANVEPYLTDRDKEFLTAYKQFVKADADMKLSVYGEEIFQALKQQEYFRRQLKELAPTDELRQMDSVDRGILAKIVLDKLAQSYDIKTDQVLSKQTIAAYNKNSHLQNMAKKYSDEAIRMVKEIIKNNPAEDEQGVRNAALNVIDRHIRQTFGAMTEENIARTIADSTFLDQHVDVGGDTMHRVLLGGYGDAHEFDVRKVLPRQVQSIMKTLPNVQLGRMVKDHLLNPSDSTSEYFGTHMKGLKDYVGTELRNTFFGGVVEDTLAPSEAARFWDKIFGTRLSTQPNSLWATSNAVSGYVYRNLLAWRPNFLAMNTLDPILKTIIKYDPVMWTKVAMPTYIRMAGDVFRPGSKLLELTRKYVAPKGSLVAELQGGTRASTADTGFFPDMFKAMLGKEGYVKMHHLWMKGPEAIEWQEHFNNQVIWAMEVNKKMYEAAPKEITDKYGPSKMLDLYLENNDQVPWLTKAATERIFRQASGEVESVQGHRSGFMGGSARKAHWLSSGKNNVPAAMYAVSKMFMNYPVTIGLNLASGMERALMQARSAGLEGRQMEMMARSVFNPLTLLLAASAATYYGVPYAIDKAMNKTPDEFDPMIFADMAMKDIGVNRAPVPIGIGLEGLRAVSGLIGLTAEWASGDLEGKDLSESKGLGRIIRAGKSIGSVFAPGANPVVSMSGSKIPTWLGVAPEKGE